MDTPAKAESAEPDPVRAARAEVERDGVARADAATALEQPGDRIGRYRLLQLIGEGGFGTVYMAEQKEPVRRRVALKVIKLGMDTRQVIARFEAERQALAMMDHPNIARVLDAGATETGRPYFVMELVRGIPITEFCDEARLSTARRLELFVKVCRAVQHAHQKGIIHRDLKPSNVLVTLHDGEPVPKVIDFGIAKATNQELTEKTLFTEFRQFLGTPEYMSPEQTDIGGLDIDTRSDVYSLGVLLYELLTGTTPVGRERFRTSLFDEIKRIIREEEAVRPSTRVSTMGESSSFVRTHGEDPSAAARALRGDLDWIVLKALEKDRTRRYESASDLAADIERHARHEPVAASPPSRAYRVRKFLRRNRGPVAAGAALGAVLVLGIAGTTSGYLRATRNLRVAREQSAIARRSREQALAEAEKQAELARFFHESIFSTSPWHETRGSEMATVVDLLRVAAARLESGALADQPASRAVVHRALGDAFFDRELWDEAVAAYVAAARALGDGAGDPLTLSHVARRLDRLARDYEEGAVPVELDTEALRALALEGLEPLLSVPDEEAVLELFQWAHLLFRTHRLEQAERLLDRVHALVAVVESRAVPFVEYAQACVRSYQGRGDEARTLFARAAEPMRREPKVERDSFFSIAIGFWVPGSLEAIGYTARMREATTGSIEGTALRARMEVGLAWQMHGEGRRDEAIEKVEEVVEMVRRFRHNQHSLGKALSALAFMLAGSGRDARALETLEEAKPLLARRRGKAYYLVCNGMAICQGRRALQLVESDPRGAAASVSAVVANLAEALAWDVPEDAYPLDYLVSLAHGVSTLERASASGPRIDAAGGKLPGGDAVRALARAWIPRFLAATGDPLARPDEVNDLVWATLCLAPLDEEQADLAVEVAAELNEQTQYGVGAYVDTLARAWFVAGDVEAAIDYQRAAIAAAASPEVRGSMEARLARYEAELRSR